MEVGWGGQTTTLTGLTDLKIHPNFRLNDNDDSIGNTDIALLKTSQDIFTINNGTPSPSNIAPICLPPKLGFKPDGTNDQNVFEPFEDLDCQQTTGRPTYIYLKSNALMPQTHASPIPLKLMSPPKTLTNSNYSVIPVANRLVKTSMWWEETLLSQVLVQWQGRISRKRCSRHMIMLVQI